MNTTDTNATNVSLTAQLKNQVAQDRERAGTRSTRWEGLLYAELSHAIVGAAIEVHRHIGPGQLEVVYQKALAMEFATREISARAQVPIEMKYKGAPVGEFFADFVVDDKIIVELKAVSGYHGAHVAQVISYLRATGLRLGLLINFNAPVLWRGVRRLIL